MRSVVFAVVLTAALCNAGVYEWMTMDRFDQIIDRMDAVNEQNCEAKSKSELSLPDNTVSQLIQANKLKTTEFQSNYYRNRTALHQLHTTVLANAYKFSYLNQQLNESWELDGQPSLFYYYLSMTADVTANLGLINASATFYDRNKFYPNFLLNVPSNDTLPLFGPRSWRIDDYNDPTNWIREPTNNTFRVTDYGAGPFRNYSIDMYKINEWYNLWLPQPSEENDAAKSDEQSVTILNSESAGNFEDQSDFSFFGPPTPFQSDSADKLPVKFTNPYFDCGRSNKWIVSAAAPIYDRLPRYPYDSSHENKTAVWDNIQSNMRVGVAVADTDFLNIDFNPCGRWSDDDGPNFFAGIDRCHTTSTICKPLSGFGFQRGGYICECRPGFRYPEYIQGPYLGVAIERATKQEYDSGFHCLAIGDRFVVPELVSEDSDNGFQDRISGTTGKKKRSVKKEIEEEKQDRKKRELVTETNKKITAYSNAKQRFLRKVIPKQWSSVRELRHQRLAERRVADFKDVPAEVMDWFKATSSDMGMSEKGRRLVAKHKMHGVDEKKHTRKKRNAFNEITYDRVQGIVDQMASITPENCNQYLTERLSLPGDTKYGVEKKLERFGRIAVRVSDFLSSFLQTINGEQSYGTLLGDRLLNEDQLIAEVLGVVLADPDVEGLGIYFDRDKFMKRDGTKKELFGPYAYTTTDTQDNHHVIDRAGLKMPYTELDWYKDVKRRWLYNTRGLQEYVLNPWIRSDDAGKNIRKHEEYPLVWKSASYEDGIWSDPYFDCDGLLKEWILSYRIPFFGNTGYGSAVEFRGVVAIDIKLDLLDIEQCPTDFFASNAFMGTARCDFETTYCSRIENKGFQLNQGYRCDCKQGYEYPWIANEYFYSGDQFKKSLQRKENDQNNRYDRLKCRMSDGSKPMAGLLLLSALMMTIFV